LPIPATKTRSPLVHLSAQAIVVAEASQESREVFVFFSGRDHPSPRLQQGKRELDALIPGVTEWRLPRSCATCDFGIGQPCHRGGWGPRMWPTRYQSPIRALSAWLPVYQRHQFLPERLRSARNWGSQYVAQIVSATLVKRDILRRKCHGAGGQPRGVSWAGPGSDFFCLPQPDNGVISRRGGLNPRARSNYLGSS